MYDKILIDFLIYVNKINNVFEKIVIFYQILVKKAYIFALK